MQKRYIEIMRQTAEASPQPSPKEREKGCALTALKTPSPLERVGVRLCGVRLLVRLLLLLLLFLTGCTKGDVLYRMVPSGYVIIHPDDSKYFLPNVRYHFYCIDGTNATPILDKCDGKGNYAGKLPVATYCVLATNTDAANVSFSGMDSQKTAIATVNQYTNRTRGSLSSGEGWGEAVWGEASGEAVFLAQPGDLYSIALDSVIPSATDTVRRAPEPVLLTRHVIFTIRLDDKIADDVTAMSGVLDGVYPSVHLFSCVAANEELNPETGATSFAIRAASANTANWRADVALFGIRDPERGNTYKNEIELTITRTDETDVVHVDISDYLSDAIEDNGGELPIRIPVEITVGPSDIGLVGDVIPWEDAGNAGGEITE